MSCSTLKTGFSSLILHHFSPSSLYQTLIKGGCRSYSYRTPFLNNPTNVYKREWLRVGLLKLHLGGVRANHGAATASMSTRDFYEVLGISKDATSSEMKNAYYALAKELHPDKNKDDSEAEKKFQVVQRAYEVLKDDETRAQYDQFGQDDGAGFGRNPFHDIFGNADIFDKDIDGQDVKVSVELSFMEAVTGCTKDVTFEADFKCGTCGGTGTPRGTRPETCKRCKGSGVEIQTTSQNGSFPAQYTCPNCNGAGKIVKNFCKTCEGKGVTKGKKSVRLDLEPGIDNDDVLKIHGSGGADPEGRQPGDLFVTVKVRDDPVFRRERCDIHVDIGLSVTQAMLGGTVQVPTLFGDTAVKVRPGTQPGQKVILKKKGIKMKKSYTFGDQYVHFNVSTPSNINSRQQEINEEFAKEEQVDYDKGAAASG